MRPKGLTKQFGMNDTRFMNEWKCKLDTWRLYNIGQAKVEKLDCKQWACLQHGEMVRWRWRKRAELVKWELMWTFTNVPDNQDEARRAWHAIRRRLKRKGVTTYLRALEIGVGGMRHWHVLVAGVKFMRRRGWDSWLSSIGIGRINHVTKVTEQNGVARYVLKYVTKGNESETHERKIRGWRRVTVSRDIPTWKRLVEVLDTNTKLIDTGGKWKLSRTNHVPANSRGKGINVTDINKVPQTGMVQGNWRRTEPVRWAERVLLIRGVSAGGIHDGALLGDITRDRSRTTGDCGRCSWLVAGGKYYEERYSSSIDDAGIDERSEYFNSGGTSGGTVVCSGADNLLDSQGDGNRRIAVGPNRRINFDILDVPIRKNLFVLQE